MKRIAVIGGTKYDTEIGCSLVRKTGRRCNGFPIASTAEEQNNLQYFSPHELQFQVEKIARKLEQSKYDSLLIFCNSLSVIVDHERLSRTAQVKIISPIHIYRTLANEFDRLFVIAANGQCLSGIERVIMNSKGSMEIFGFSNLAIVNSIEKGLPPEAVFREFHLDLVISLAESLSTQSIVLGCTHLANLYGLIRKHSSIPVIDVGRELVKRIGKGSGYYEKTPYSLD